MTEWLVIVSIEKSNDTQTQSNTWDRNLRLEEASNWELLSDSKCVQCYGLGNKSQWREGITIKSGGKKRFLHCDTFVVLHLTEKS